MKIEKPVFEIWIQEPGLNGVYRQIERAGRVCYKSENRRSAGSAKPFVERMIKSDHTAMLEHGSLYLTLSQDVEKEKTVAERYMHNKFSHANTVDGKTYVTSNLRVLVENNRMDDLQYLTEPTRLHDRRVTVHFTTQIGTTREFNRHRANSMAEQSTRYCNYAKDKFGNEIAINLPVWAMEQMAEQGGDVLKCTAEDLPVLFQKVYAGTATDLENWVFANLSAERAYMNLMRSGRKPQEARAVLPLDTNTELVHTAFVSDWQHFFDLRATGTTGAPHPDAKVLAGPLMEEFKRLGLIEP